MSRLTVAAVRTEVLNAARQEELQVAAGRNRLISKTEQAALPSDLHEIVEAVRAREPGQTVSVDDAVGELAARFDHAVAAVNQSSGPGRVVLSQAERLAVTDQAYFIGQRLERAVEVLTGEPLPPPLPLNAADASTALGALAPQLMFDGLLGSEGGEPVELVVTTKRLPAPPTGAELARALGHDPDTLAGAVEMFRAPSVGFLKEFLAQQGALPKADVDKLASILTGLTDLRVLVVGKDGGAGVDANHPTYIVGQATDGVTVGLKTGVIWT